MRFHRTLFLKVQLAICQHWIRYWLSANQATGSYMDQWWPSLLAHICVTQPDTQSIIRFFFLYIKLMCPYFILLIYTDGERDGLWMACPFRTLVVLYRMFPFIICLILMNYLMEFYFIGFVNAHLPGCFCPWTFRLNIGLNTSPSDSFVSYLNSHLGYSAGEFQALQLIVLAVFGAVD